MADALLDMIGRKGELFRFDVEKWERELAERVGSSRFLVIGGGGVDRAGGDEGDF